MSEHRAEAQPPFLGPKSTPLTPEELPTWEDWTARVRAGEVPPREVAAGVDELLSRFRATLEETEPPTPSTETRLLTIREAAPTLKCPVSGVYDLIYSQVLPAECVVRLGRRVRLHEARFRAWLDAGGAALPRGWRRAEP